MVAVAVAVTAPLIPEQQLGFDEGWNLQAPYELAQEGKYASFGAVFDGQTKVFDPFLSTGPAVSLPIGIVFKGFGVGVEQARVVMLGFFMAAICLMAWYAYDKTRSLFAWLAPLILFLVLSSGMLMRIEVLGEMPAIVYALASMLALRFGKYWLSGFFAAMAVFSKVLMFQLVAAIGLCFIVWLIRHHKKWKIVIKRAVQWGSGIAVPIVAWEIVRFVQLGGTPGAYIQNLKEYVRVFKANGSGVGDSGSIVPLSLKWDLLISNILLHHTLMIIGAVLLVVGIIVGYRKLRPALAENMYGLGFVAIYCVWWFGVSNGGYARYAFPLFIIAWVVLLHVFLRVFVDSDRKIRWVGIGLKLGLAIIMVAGIMMLYTPTRLVANEAPLSEQKTVARLLKEASPVHLTHIGWWQNPEILFLSGMHSQEIGYRKPGETYELLLSPAIRAIVPKEYKAILEERCNQGIIFQTPGYILCRGIVL